MAVPEDSWVWIRSLLPNAQSFLEHWGFFQEHHMTLSRNVVHTVAWRSLEFCRVLSLHCTFLEKFYSGPTGGLGEKGQKENMSTERAVPWLFIQSANIYWTPTLPSLCVLCGPGHIISSFICDFPYFSTLGQAWTGSLRGTRGGEFRDRSLFYKRNTFETYFKDNMFIR